MTPRIPFIAARSLTLEFGLPRRPTLADSPVWGGTIATLIGLTVLFGWAVGNDTLKSMIPGVLTMKANTGVCFVLLGTGVGILFRADTPSRPRTLGLALVAAPAAIAIATGAQYVLGRDFGIDQLLFHEPIGAIGTVKAGRMSPLTAICFVLLAAATGLAVVKSGSLARARVRSIVIAMASVTLALSVLNIFDFIFDAQVPSFLAGYTQMAVNTAIAMSIVSVAVLGLLGAASPLMVLSGRSTTVLLVRRLLAVIIAVPVVIAWLRLEGQRLGLYDTSYGISLMLVGILSLAVITILGSARWATELEAKRDVVELERDRYFELSLDMLSVIDSHGTFRRVNRAWHNVLGYPDGYLVGRQYLEFLHPDDLERTLAEAAREYGAGEQSVGFQNRYRHYDGSYRWLEWMSTTSPDLTVAYGSARDVTSRKNTDDRRARRERVLERRNEALSKRVVLDPLTGLHNRRHFDVAVKRMERRWSRSTESPKRPVSVIMFDLDHFGEVNKQHGHQAGDAVLRVFGALLTKRFREGDVVARYGGEEFVAVLEGSTAASASRAAEDIRIAFEAIAVDIGTGTPLQVTVSAGCAQLDHDRNVSAGLAVADVWLAQAKRSGRNQVVGL